jgi:ATP-dependent DNA helicase RecG
VRSFASKDELTKPQLLAAPIRWPRPSLLEQPLTTLPGVGPKLAEAAADAGLELVSDLLLRFPRSHRDRTVEPLAEIEEGREVTVRVEVAGSKPRPFRRRGLTIINVKVSDASGAIKAVWFNQPWVAEKLEPGTLLMLTGSLGKGTFRVAEYEVISDEEGAGLGTDTLVPVHPATERLKPQRLRQWIEQACAFAGDAIEPLPAELRARRRLAPIGDALRGIHFPNREDELETARRRLAFEELFLYQAILATRKRSHRTARPAPPLGKPGELVARWLGSLPFELTGDQRAAIAEIDADLARGEPMQRLLMGEVGSGKTIVAVYTMLRAMEAGFQAALMAPTETLAEQHATTLDRLLGREAIGFALLTGATPAPQRKQALDKLASGELSLVIGTHALIEPAVRFARLAVCVIDEQHRFGVQQRQALDAKGAEGGAPHVLHMTATPIPRTLSLTAYGDLDTTALRELPAGRHPVKTRLVNEGSRDAAYEFVRKQLREGRQAYVVCPLVTESEKLQGRAAEEEMTRLAGGELKDFRLGVIHGQMQAVRKGETMDAFVAGELDVLVATTVIEVGVDVPNATVMMIEGAERYGVSQLHQLRGRVGRGEHSSYCLLFAEHGGQMARRRLQAVEGERDGFKLAELDLSLRGEGEVLGTRQHGLPRFAAAELPEETNALVEARDEVLALLRRHGSLDVPELGPLLDVAQGRYVSADAPIQM